MNEHSFFYDLWSEIKKFFSFGNGRVVRREVRDRTAAQATNPLQVECYDREAAERAQQEHLIDASLKDAEREQNQREEERRLTDEQQNIANRDPEQVINEHSFFYD